MNKHLIELFTGHADYISMNGDEEQNVNLLCLVNDGRTEEHNGTTAHASQGGELIQHLHLTPIRHAARLGSSTTILNPERHTTLNWALTIPIKYPTKTILKSVSKRKKRAVKAMLIVNLHRKFTNRLSGSPTKSSQHQ